LKTNIVYVVGCMKMGLLFPPCPVVYYKEICNEIVLNFEWSTKRATHAEYELVVHENTEVFFS
jgi:predicted metal-binding protein